MVHTILFGNFLIFPAAEIHFPDRDFADLDNLGRVDGGSAYSNMITFNSGISSLVVVAYILTILLLIRGIVNLSLPYKYLCLAASLILWVLCLINLKMIDSIIVPGALANSVTLDIWKGLLIPLGNFALIVNIVRSIKELKKFQIAQANNQGVSHEFNS